MIEIRADLFGVKAFEWFGFNFVLISEQQISEKKGAFKGPESCLTNYYHESTLNNHSGQIR